ncbi:MAG: DUF4476 domain-containing protein [Chitinophagaceae bacterium]
MIKKFLVLIICLKVGLFVMAQQAVTVTVESNEIRQIKSDSKFSVNVKENESVILNNMAAGKHTLEFITNSYGNKLFNGMINYYVRTNYNQNIIVHNDGSISTEESLNVIDNNAPKVPVSNAVFSTMLRDVRYLRYSQKPAAIKNIFTTQGNYFTTAQVKELVQLVSAQNTRLDLAKAAYPMITDPQNFSTVSNLLYSKALRDELQIFVNNNQSPLENISVNYPLSDAEFNTIYKSAQSQNSGYTRLTYLSNIFSDTKKYFRSEQLKKLIQLTETENERMQLAKNAYRSVIDPVNFYQIFELLNGQYAKTDLSSYIKNYNSGLNKTQMSSTAYNSIFSAAQNQNSADTRLSYVLNTFYNPNNYFAVDQVKRLMQLFNGEADLFQIARESYDNITDQSNFSQLYSLLSNESNKNELSLYVKSYTEGLFRNNEKVAMTDAEYSNIYRNIQFSFGFGAKMSSLTDLFADDTKYFTAAQISQLIQLVSDENNRLQLAKSAYNNMSDTQNYTKVNEVFSSQSSINDYMAYVQNYSGM